MLSEFSGKDEADSGLYLSGGEGVLLVVADELGCLEGDLLEDVIDERVHDVHRSLGHANLGVHLLQHSVDVNRESLNAATVNSLLHALCNVLLGHLLGSGSALGGTGSLLGSHFEKLVSF